LPFLWLYYRGLTNERGAKVSTFLYTTCDHDQDPLNAHRKVYYSYFRMCKLIISAWRPWYFMFRFQLPRSHCCFQCSVSAGTVVCTIMDYHSSVFLRTSYLIHIIVAFNVRMFYCLFSDFITVVTLPPASCSALADLQDLQDLEGIPGGRHNHTQVGWTDIIFIFVCVLFSFSYVW